MSSTQSSLNKPYDPTTRKPYGWLVLGALGAYLISHLLFGEEHRIPETTDLVTVNADGEVVEVDQEALEWFADPDKLENFKKSNEASSEDLRLVTAAMRTYVEEYERETLGSNEQRISMVRTYLDEANFERAAEVWTDIRKTTSPRTQAHLGGDAFFKKGDAALERSTKAVESQILEATGLDLAQQSPVLWSTRPGLRSEAVWWALIGLLFGLWLRHRSLQAEHALVGERRFTVADLLKVAVGLALAWLMIYVLQHLGMRRQPMSWVAVFGGLAIGWITVPFLRSMIVPVETEPAYAAPQAPKFAASRPLAPVLPLPVVDDKDAEEMEAALEEEETIRDTKALRKLRADRRRNLQVVLSRLHPKSFGELHQLATDYSRKFVIGEVQEPKDLA